MSFREYCSLGLLQGLLIAMLTKLFYTQFFELLNYVQLCMGHCLSDIKVISLIFVVRYVFFDRQLSLT